MLKMLIEKLTGQKKSDSSARLEAAVVECKKEKETAIRNCKETREAAVQAQNVASAVTVQIAKGKPA